MTPEQAFELITKVAEAANKAGILTIDNAVDVKFALNTLQNAVKVANETYAEEVPQEQPKSKK